MDSVHRIEKKIVKKNFQDFFFVEEINQSTIGGFFFFRLRHTDISVCVCYI